MFISLPVFVICRALIRFLLSWTWVSFLIRPCKALCNLAETSHSRPFTSKCLIRVNSKEKHLLDMYVLPLMMVGSCYMEGPLSDALDTYMAGVIFTASLSFHCQTCSFNRLINHLCHSLSIPSLKLLSKSSAAVFCQYLGVLTRGCKCHCRGLLNQRKV